MDQRRLKRTDQKDSGTGKGVTDFGHDLNALLKQLQGFSCTIPKIKAKDSTQIEADSLHQAWRYGKRLEVQNEEICLKKLNEVFNELKKQIKSKGK